MTGLCWELTCFCSDSWPILICCCVTGQHVISGTTNTIDFNLLKFESLKVSNLRVTEGISKLEFSNLQTIKKTEFQNFKLPLPDHQITFDWPVKGRNPTTIVVLVLVLAGGDLR